MKLVRYQIPQSNWTPFSRLPAVSDLFEVLSRENGSVWRPALDLSEDAEKFTVALEIPGLKKEDFEISLHEGNLHISGEKKAVEEKKEGTTYRSERFYGKFERVIALPSDVDGSKVDAKYQDGVLSITLAKAETAKPKKIDVTVS